MILVTGAAGFIGSNFVRLLLQKGFEVTGLDSFTYAGREENLKTLPKENNFRLLRGDICHLSIDTLRSLQPKWIVNFAAETHVDRSLEDPRIFGQTNLMGTLHLLQTSLQYWMETNKNRDFRFLQISTDEVYGSLGKEGLFQENSPLKPSSPYSATKAGGDHLALAWFRSFGLPTMVSRCSNNYGPYQNGEKLIPKIIANALTGREIPIYSRGENIRDWIHVEDHCEGVLAALQRGSPGETYCFGGEEKSNLVILETILSYLERTHGLSGLNKLIRFVEDRPGHDFRYAIDSSKAQADLGFQQTHSLVSGLSATVDWYVTNQNWWKGASE